jgi:hypothetical protein
MNILQQFLKTNRIKHNIDVNTFKFDFLLELIEVIGTKQVKSIQVWYNPFMNKFQVEFELKDRTQYFSDGIRKKMTVLNSKVFRTIEDLGLAIDSFIIDGDMRTLRLTQIINSNGYD